VRRLVLVAVAVLVSVVAPAAGRAPPDEPLEEGTSRGRSRSGSRSMYLQCYGAGSPTVILDMLTRPKLVIDEVRRVVRRCAERADNDETPLQSGVRVVPPRGFEPRFPP
jgi:hypothetical protein